MKPTDEELERVANAVRTAIEPPADEHKSTARYWVRLSAVSRAYWDAIAPLVLERAAHAVERERDENERRYGADDPRWNGFTGAVETIRAMKETP
ncbi:MAG TPA: hypothetical protein VEA41_02185 [Salinarimonas sp.]|nr:hypothetical protein [Salinarimonas sp.]